MKSRIIFLLVVVAVLMPFDHDAQCAMCKSAAETDMKSNPGSIARGLNSGILYLMAVPYIAIAFIFRKQLWTLWTRIVRRLKMRVQGS